VKEVKIEAEDLDEMKFILDILFRKGEDVYIGYTTQCSGAICLYLIYIFGVPDKLGYPIRATYKAGICHYIYAGCKPIEEGVKKQYNELANYAKTHGLAVWGKET